MMKPLKRHLSEELGNRRALIANGLLSFLFPAFGVVWPVATCLTAKMMMRGDERQEVRRSSKGAALGLVLGTVLNVGVATALAKMEPSTLAMNSALVSMIDEPNP